MIGKFSQQLLGPDEAPSRFEYGPLAVICLSLVWSQCQVFCILSIVSLCLGTISSVQLLCSSYIEKENVGTGVM
jgi:hypothetical protein